jgi:hypothetical protein
VQLGQEPRVSLAEISFVLGKGEKEWSKKQKTRQITTTCRKLNCIAPEHLKMMPLKKAKLRLRATKEGNKTGRLLRSRIPGRSSQLTVPDDLDETRKSKETTSGNSIKMLALLQQGTGLSLPIKAYQRPFTFNSQTTSFKGQSKSYGCYGATSATTKSFPCGTLLHSRQRRKRME